MSYQVSTLIACRDRSTDIIEPNLDGHLSDYLPYYRKDTGNRVMVRQLLSHTSGIPNFVSTPSFLDGPASRTTYNVKDFAQKYCSGDLEFEPRTRFHYSNSGYFLLGAILEQVSGSPYEQLLKDRIFTPLGMTDSGYAHGERLLPANLCDLLFKPNLENYGFGWGVLIPKPGSPDAGETLLMHGGAIFGFQSVIERIPKQKELIVMLDNTDSPKLLEIALDIRRVLSDKQ